MTSTTDTPTTGTRPTAVTTPVLAAVSLTSVIYTVINLGVDVLYVWLDPRVRLRA